MDAEELTRRLAEMSEMAQGVMPKVEKLAEYAAENEVPGLMPLLTEVMSLMAWIRSSVVEIENVTR